MSVIVGAIKIKLPSVYDTRSDIGLYKIEPGTDDWASRTSAADNAWRSVCYGNGLFVAVSSTGSGNRVMTSPDGITWTIRTSAADNEWRSVCYGNGLFVAVSQTGSSNRVMTSPDGITWTIRSTTGIATWVSVCYGDGLFVAVADWNSVYIRVMTSPDGITWTNRTAGSTTYWSSVCYGNGLFVVVGRTGGSYRVMTSPDGITWTGRTAAANNDWRSVCYGNGLFVAVSSTGSSNRVMTSPDGITWTSRTSAADNQWYGVCYENGLFVAVAIDGSGNRVMTSPDGITWTIRTSAADNQWYGVCYGNGLFVAVSVDGSGNRVMTAELQEATGTEIRHSEVELFGVSDTYNHEMILKDGIGDIRKSFDSSLGGNIETVNNFTVRLKGTNQFVLRLAELGIELSGKTIEYIEFDGTDIDSDANAETVMFTGTIEDVEYNQFETSIIAKTSFQYKRNRHLGDDVTDTDYPYAPSAAKNGVTPLTFGSSDPDNGRFFKLIKIADKKQVLNVEDILPAGNPLTMSLFAAANFSGSDYQADEIALLLGDTAPYTGYAFADKYVKIVECTDSENVGEIRKINQLFGTYGWYTSGYGVQKAVYLELSEYFPKAVASRHVSEPDAAFPSFAQLIDALIRYIMDHDYSKCFADSITELYIKSGDEMIKAIDIGVSQVTAAIPHYEVNSSVFNDEIGNTKSYTYLPVESIEPYESATNDLDIFGIDTAYQHPLDGSSDKIAGVFCRLLDCDASFQGDITGPNNFNDRDHTTQYTFATEITKNQAVYSHDYLIVIKVVLPEIPDTIQFDSVYLGIDCISQIDNGGTPFSCTGEFSVYYKSFYNRVVNPFTYNSMLYQNNVGINCLPDDYYTSGQDNSNRQFHLLEEDTASLKGYKNFDLEIDSVEDYKNIHELIVVFKRLAEPPGVLTFDDYIIINDLAIIFEKNVTLGESVYA